MSTPSSTKCTVTPVTRTPWASACPIASSPGNDGSSAGWTLMIRFAEAARRTPPRAAACSRRARRARLRRSSSQSAIAHVARLPVARSRRAGRPPVATPAASARSSARAPGLSEPTADDLDRPRGRGAGRGSPAGSSRSRGEHRDPERAAPTWRLRVGAQRLAAGTDGELLERELAVRRSVAERVAAGEAGVAVVLGGRADRLVDAVEREVGERVGAEVLGDLVDRPLVGDHLLARRHVDAVVAGVADRRRGDPQVDLLGAGVAQHPDDLAGRVAADDRVVDDDEPLARDDLRQRVELHPQAVLAQLLARLDEGAGHVAVLDQAVVLRDAPRRARSRRPPGCPESGTEITRSASTGASRQRISPILPRTCWRTRPSSRVSGREK